MDYIGPREIELKIHGLVKEDHGRVPGRVFANKLKQLISALEAADILANGKVTHEYVLSSMHMSNPTAILKEVVKAGEEEGRSSIPVFEAAVDDIKTASGQSVHLGPLVRRVGLLAGGAENSFLFGEVRTASSNVIRIDDFLRRRAIDARVAERGEWFEGVAFGSFDGILQYADTRGANPLIKLTLSAGGKEIDCICKQDEIATIGKELDHRVRVYGRAFYSAKSPLPERVEVTKITPVRTNADLSKWVGSFKSFEAEDWDGQPDA